MSFCTSTLAILLAGIALGQPPQQPAQTPHADLSRSIDPPKYTNTLWFGRLEQVRGASVFAADAKLAGTLAELAIDAESGQIAFAVIEPGRDANASSLAIPWNRLQARAEGGYALPATVERMQSVYSADEAWAQRRERSAEAGKPDASASSALLRASDLMDKPVHRPGGQRLGEIEGLLVDTTNGRIACVVISFGGFAEIGNRLFAVPWARVKPILARTEGRQPAALERAEFDIDPEALKSAPYFTEQTWPKPDDPGYYATVYRFYSVSPYWE